MQQSVSISNALISVFYKDGLDEIVHELASAGVSLYSTGGTATYIEQLGLPVNQVEDLTSLPQHSGWKGENTTPKMFGGILPMKDHAGDGADGRVCFAPHLIWSLLTCILLRKPLPAQMMNRPS